LLRLTERLLTERLLRRGGGSTAAGPRRRSTRARPCEAPQAAIPIRGGADLAKNFARARRRTRRRNTGCSTPAARHRLLDTGCSAASTPCP
jgi:hypothetical protein